MKGWNTWQEFKASQKEIELTAGNVVHIPVTIRYLDAGEARLGTVLLMHGIPTWGYLYHAVIPILVDTGYRVSHPISSATAGQTAGIASIVRFKIRRE